MDELLIAEVQKQPIIFNRQKSTAGNGENKGLSKEIAWTKVAINLRADGKFCEIIAKQTITIYCKLFSKCFSIC